MIERIWQKVLFEDKGKRTKEKTMQSSGLILLTSLLLLFTLAGAATACPPDCNDSNDCGPCQECVGGSCQDQCTGCQECVNNNCEDEDENCEGEQTCCCGVCCDNECCNQTCCGDPNEECCNNQCCGNECCNNTCCDPNQSCCENQCCDNCCNEVKCCDPCDVCCSDSGTYCCEPNEACCGGPCCPEGQKCCKDAEPPYCCDSYKECCEGSCCDPNQCEECECVSDCNVCCQDCENCPDPNCCICETTCNTAGCYQCDGNGECVYQCDEDQCEDCNTNNGACEVICSPCAPCDGQGNCVCSASVISVNSDKEAACVGCNITFTAATDPAASCVLWSGGGDPETGSGVTFTTHWDLAGAKTVTATCANSKQKQVTIYDCDNPPTIGRYEIFDAGFKCPRLVFGCSGTNPAPDSPDDCGNTLEIKCDWPEPNHCSFRYWYNSTEVGRCVWEGGMNLYEYKITLGGERFLETTQLSCNDAKGFDSQGEGCFLYWCWRRVEFNCVTEAAPEVNWVKSTNFSKCPCEDGTGIYGPECFAEEGIHWCHPD